MGEGGAQLAALLMVDPRDVSLGWSLPLVIVDQTALVLSRLLGEGRYGIVFATEFDRRPCLVKVFRDRRYAELEERALELLSKRPDLQNPATPRMTRLIKRSGDGGALVLEPIATPFARGAAITLCSMLGRAAESDTVIATADHFTCLVETLRLLHAPISGCRLVHRDISPPNIFAHKVRIRVLASSLPTRDHFSLMLDVMLSGSQGSPGNIAYP